MRESSLNVACWVRFTVKPSIICFLLTCVLTDVSYALMLRAGLTTDEKGYIKIETPYQGLDVSIDGQFVGYTPLEEVLAVTPGPHTIRVRHPSRYNWNELDFTQDINASPGDTLSIEAIFQKNYSINSHPFGAQVFLALKSVGETPVRVLLKENESADVTLNLAGYRDTTFTIGKDNERLFDIRLHSLQPTMRPDAVRLNNKARYKMPFLVSLGTALVSGGLALYFRTKADDRFDQYLRTGESRKFKRLFNDSKRFDKFAAASFGVFQVSFAFSFFFFLKRAKN